MEKPPIGITPRYIHDLQRHREVADAIQRYVAADAPLLIEWIDEYNDFIRSREGTEAKSNGECKMSTVRSSGTARIDINTNGWRYDGSKFPTVPFWTTPNNPCDKCPNHPKNGGSGICNCTLGTPKITLTL